jgi:ketosteroid isomerase-like protein
MADQEHLLALERAFWHAAGDASAYADALADDAVHVLPGLGIVDRDTALRGVAGADPWDDFAIEAPLVVELGRDAAALVYTATARRGDDRYRAAVTSVYLRADNRWQLALHQQTPL